MFSYSRKQLATLNFYKSHLWTEVVIRQSNFTLPHHYLLLLLSWKKKKTTTVQPPVWPRRAPERAPGLGSIGCVAPQTYKLVRHESRLPAECITSCQPSPPSALPSGLTDVSMCTDSPSANSGGCGLASPLLPCNNNPWLILEMCADFCNGSNCCMPLVALERCVEAVICFCSRQKFEVVQIVFFLFNSWDGMVTVILPKGQCASKASFFTLLDEEFFC